MGAFFVDWALWVKMVFVLGIAIVFTLIAGLIKLAFDHAKLKKYAQIEMEKQEKQEALPMVEEQARQRRGRQDVPFGIRAIESGIEVEGVWISRTNTPASSAPVSPMLSPQLGKAKNPSKLSLLQLSTEQTLPSQSDRSRSPEGSMGSFEKATSAERLDSPSTFDLHSRPTYQPRNPSSLRFSTADQLEAGQFPSRTVSDSSKSSSDESSHALQSPPYHQAREPSYYRPTGAGYAAISSGPPSPAMLRPEYVQPGRSSRNSNPVQGYVYGPTGSTEQQSRPPQRFYGPGQSQNNNHTSYSTQYLPDEEVFVDAPSKQRSSRLESIELVSNPVMTDSSSDKTKRISRKLQKKQTK